jgi:hypothetical protein
MPDGSVHLVDRVGLPHGHDSTTLEITDNLSHVCGQPLVAFRCGLQMVSRPAVPDAVTTQDHDPVTRQAGGSARIWQPMSAPCLAS